MKIDINIKFSQDEQEVISILKEVATRYSPSIKIYLVGGAVRDKLLGLASNDMDIMIYPDKAESFSKLITNHLGIKDPHVIQENPEKSRNISTTKVYFPTSNGIKEVDFAQARSETYSDSRIPIIQAATPEEDAMRRDFTVNSIMYRIYPLPQQIEDFTGKGIKDLISNTIRTPLDPLKTFKDDPLRIFRCIRFASKLGFNIDPETYNALTDPSLREEIQNKISKERIGQEIEKIFKNKNAEIAINILKDTGILEDLVNGAIKGTKYEGKMKQFNMDQNNPNHKLNWFEHTFEVVKNTLEKYKDTEPEKKAVMTLAALFHDLGKLFEGIQTKKEGTDKYPGYADGYTSYIGHEEESKRLTELILKYIKLEPLIQQVSLIAGKHMEPHSLVRDENASEKALRKFIRRCSEESIEWLDVFNLAMADAYSKSKEVSPETVNLYKNLEARLQQALISMAPAKDNKVKPVLDGNEIMQILNIKPGPQMKEIVEFVKDLQDENPQISKEEVSQKIRERFQPKPIQSTQPPETIKQAGMDDKKKTAFCPKHLMTQKAKDIQDAIDNNKLYEANSIMKQLIDEYHKDEGITRMVAINTLKILIKDETLRDNNILQYVFDRAVDNFFDYILGAYALGLLILLETGTKENVIREVASRTKKLSPGIFKSVLNMLPKDKVFNKKLMEEIL